MIPGTPKIRAPESPCCVPVATSEPRSVEAHGYLPRMFTILRSSAGAGKTHALVKHYLTHCLRGDVAAYRQVLALTFTNKAAGEMKERVVRYLELLASGTGSDGAIRDVMDHLTRETKVDEAAVSARAREVLKHMLHHWSEVAISTIDAFTRRVVQPFARDLQLEHDLKMTTEERWYRDRAVEDLIAEAGVDPLVTELLSEACQQLLHEERPWDPGTPLRELSQELGKERASAPLRSLHHMDPSAVRPLADRLRAETHAFKTTLARIGAEAHRRIEEAGLQVEDLAHGKSGFHGWFKKLKEFGDTWIGPSANTLKAIESGKWYSGKAHPDAKATLEGLAPVLQQLYHEAQPLLEKEQASYFLRRAILRELPAAFALGQLDRVLAQLKEEDGVAFFSDLTSHVAQVVRDEPVPYIYERLGERYRHFLIDEFQDTSLLQWTTLLPLIDNAIASGGSALLVGDAKQAIYRWRNGEVRLFTHLPELYPPASSAVELERQATLQRSLSVPAPLVDNHRSASTVVEFNNALFGPLAHALPTDLRSVYDAHEQGPRKKSPGLVHLKKLGKEVSGEDARQAMKDFLMASVHEALQDGFTAGDIAVLVRSGSMGRAMSEHLLSHGITVISPDGLSLRGDPAIDGIVNVLRYLHDADPTAATKAVQQIARMRGVGSTPLDPFKDTELSDPSQQLRSWLGSHGSPHLRTTLAALVVQLARAMGIKPAEDAQLITLLDEVHTWTTDHGQDLGGFLQHWERSGGDRVSSPPPNAHAAQVMTVHKAKGLEFPVVILPSTRMSKSGASSEHLWIHPGTSVPELEFALVRESAALGALALPEVEEELGLRTLDALDLLYVAFTRPKQRLYAMVPEARPDAVTTALLTFMQEQAGGDDLILGERTPPWERRTEQESTSLVDVAATDERPAVTIRFEAPETWDPEDPDPYRRFGNAVHETLGRVRHAGTLSEAMAASINEGLLTGRDAKVLLDKLGPLLSSEELAPYFGAHLTVRTEASIITADGKSLRPDRLVFEGDVARVLDIKTGVPDERHEEQVRRYMRMLVELGHPRVEGALLYISSGTLIPVVA